MIRKKPPTSSCKKMLGGSQTATDSQLFRISGGAQAHTASFKGWETQRKSSWSSLKVKHGRARMEQHHRERVSPSRRLGTARGCNSIRAGGSSGTGLAIFPSLLNKYWCTDHPDGVGRTPCATWGEGTCCSRGLKGNIWHRHLKHHQKVRFQDTTIHLLRGNHNKTQAPHTNHPASLQLTSPSQLLMATAAPGIPEMSPVNRHRCWRGSRKSTSKSSCHSATAPGGTSRRLGLSRRCSSFPKTVTLK